MEELGQLHTYSSCLPVASGPEHPQGKVNILLQAHISRERLDSFSLISDSAYVVQVNINK